MSENNGNLPFNRQYLNISKYVVFTAIILFIAYRVVTNIDLIANAAFTMIGNVFSALSPLFIGLLIAYLLGPMVNLIDNRIMTRFFSAGASDPLKAAKREKLLHTVSILLTFLFILAALVMIIYALAVLIVGQLFFSSLNQMVQSIVDYFMKYEQILRDLASSIPGSGIEERLQEVITALAAWLSDHISTSAVLHFVMGLGGGILNVVLGAVISVYLLLDADFFKRLWRKFLSLSLPQKRIPAFNDILSEINIVIGKFLRGQLLDGLIIAILSSLGLTLVGLDFAVFIGFFAGLANIIPYFGPIMGMIPAVIVALLTGGIGQAFLSVLVLFVIQQVDSAIISPRIVGSVIGLHPVFVLISVVFAGFFWGIPGMLLAVPCAAILKLFLVKRFGPV